VKKYLGDLPVKIFNILYLCCKESKEVSSYIFENDEFFSGQLKYYPSEIGVLLQEAIGNVSSLKASE
jgi:hypothetical protein